MGKLTISMAIFNSYVKLPEGSDSSCELWFVRLSEYLVNGVWFNIRYLCLVALNGGM